MEYVKGGTLSRLFKKEVPLSEQQVSLLLKSLLEGVNYIHDMNYIHRDLKPENILLSESEKIGNVKIVDFGLSAMHKVLNFK